jgi:pimeloyl-ACP methyl ester carboxylesterase
MLMVPGDPKVLSKMANPRRYIDTDYMLENFTSLYGDGDGGKGFVARLRAPTRRGYAYQLAAMAGWTSALFLPFIKARTLVLMGEDDRIVPMINGRLLAALIPHARLATMPGGHLFLISRASVAAPMIEAFLDEPDEEPAIERRAA